MNTTITEIKNTPEGNNSRITEAEEWISALEDRMVKITAEEQNKGKRIKRIEDSLRDLWDILNAPTFELQGFQKKKKKGTEKIFEEIIVENFPNVEKRNLLILLVGMLVGTATMENSMEVPQKAKSRATI